MIKPRALIQMLVFVALPLLVEGLRAATIPSNIEEGFLPPITEAQGQTLFFELAGPTAGGFILQRSALGSASSLDIPIILHDATFFEVDAPPGIGVYRLRNAQPDGLPFRFDLNQIRPSTNRAFKFPVLGGWETRLQVLEEGTATWRDLPSRLDGNGFLSFPPPKVSGPLRVVAEPPIDRESYEAIFVGGQSNALIGDNYYHSEKDTNVVYIDHELRFRHPARFYEDLKNYHFAYSFASGAASALSKHTGRKYMLVGVAVGGTPMSQWMPGEDRFDRATLFGQANFRRVAAAPQPVRAIWYYGHESSGGYPSAPNYLTEWKRLMGEWQKELGPVPVIFAQLAKSTNPDEHRFMFTATEQQRLSEEGQSEGTEGHHMVVTFDLPLGDGLHLSGEANRILGTRFERAMREHVYGEAIDGTGPRLVSVARVGDLIFRVTFTQVINEPVNGYDGQFRVVDANGPVTIIGYDRADDGRSIHLRLRRRPEGVARVSYGEPGATGDLVYLTNVVRNAEGLPAPAFGPLEVR